MDLSDLLTNCRVVSAVQSSLDDMEQRPAVYAFYDSLQFQATSIVDDIDKFKTSHARALELKIGEKLGETYLPEHARVCFRGDPTPFKGEGRKLVQKMDGDQLADMVRHLHFLSFLNEPLYVGKTTNMRERFDAHHSKDFLFFMKDVRKRHPGEFVLFVYYCPADFARAIESILLQIFKPPFSTQQT